jgi:GNAT superfamily N-acetyltransferase
MNRPIKQTIDKNGGKVNLFRLESLSFSPVIPLMLRVHAEIVEKGSALPMIPFNNNSKIAWAERPDGTVIGGICYEYIPETKCGWLILSFTSPEERGKGINALIHEIYESECRRLGATYLSSFVDLNNESRLNSLKSVGMIPKMYKTFKQIA